MPLGCSICYSLCNCAKSALIQNATALFLSYVQRVCVHVVSTNDKRYQNKTFNWISKDSNSNIRCDAKTYERALHCYRECVMLSLLCIAPTQLYAWDLALRRSQLLGTDSRVFPVELGETFPSSVGKAPEFCRSCDCRLKQTLSSCKIVKVLLQIHHNHYFKINQTED